MDISLTQDLQSVMEQPVFEMLRQQVQSPSGIVPYVGAGISVPFGIPAWGKLLRDIAPVGSVRDEVDRQLATGSFSQSASIIEDVLGSKRFSEAFKTTFFGRELHRPTQETAVELLPALATSIVMTTNFDRVLESIFEENGSRFEKVYLGTSSDGLMEDLQVSRRTLIKIHGDFGDTVNRILTSSEYASGYEVSQSGFDHTRLLMRVLQSRTVLFIGSSIVHDEVYRVLCDLSLEQHAFPHYSIMPEPKTQDEKSDLQAKLELAGLRVLWYPHQRHELLAPIIRELVFGQNAIGTTVRLPLEWRDQFVRSEFSTTIQTVFRHDWQLVGREPEISSLIDWGTNSSEPIGLLRGIGGIGKTRLLLQFAERIERSHGAISVRFCTDHGWTSEHYTMLRQGMNIIIVDNAHKSQVLGQVLALARANISRVKVLLSFRHIAESAVEAALYDGGFIHEQELHRFAELRPLSLEQTITLLNQVLGKFDVVDVESLAEATRDSPLKATLVATLLQRGATVPDLLQNHEDFRRLVEWQFRDEIAGTLSENYPQNQVKRVLQTIAATSPLRLEIPVVAEKLRTFTGTDSETLIRLLDDLYLGGVLRRRGGLTEIAPDFLSDFILQNACLTRGNTATGFADRVFDAFGDVCFEEIMMNLSVLDWRVRNIESSGPSLMRSIWEEMEQAICRGSLFERTRILETLGRIVHTHPTFIRPIVHGQVAFWRGYRSSDSDQTYQVQQYSDVLSRILTRLAALGTGTSYDLDLLFEIGADDNRALPQTPEHALRLIAELAGYGLWKPYSVSAKVVDWIETRMESSPSQNREILLVPILEAVMKRSGYTGRSYGNRYVSHPYVVSREKTQQTREKAMTLLGRLTESTVAQVRITAASVLANVANPSWSSQDLQKSEEWVEEWEPESCTAVNILTVYLEQETDPVARLTVLDSLATGSHNLEDSPSIALLDAKSELSDKELLVLSIAGSKWYGLRKFLLGDVEECSAGPLKLSQMIAPVLDRKFRDGSLFEVIQEVCIRLSEAKVEYWYSTFWQQLAEEVEPVLESIVSNLCEDSESAFAHVGRITLHVLHARNAEKVHRLVQDALDSNTIDVRVLRDWWHICSDELLEEDIELGYRLLSLNDLDITYGLLWSAKALIPKYSAVVKQILAKTEVGSNPLIQDEWLELTTLLLMDSPESFTTTELLEIADQSSNFRSWQGYYCQEFLARVFQLDPLHVVQLVCRRVSGFTEGNLRHIEPFPHFDGKRVFQAQISAEDRLAALKALRDFVNPDIWEHSFWIGPAFAALVGEDLNLGVAVLDEYWKSNSRNQVRVAAQLFVQLDRSVVFDRPTLISEYLDESRSFGIDVFQEVKHGFEGQILAGTRKRTPGSFQGYPEDIQIVERANSAAGSLVPGSVGVEFYTEVAEAANSRIQWEVSRDEEEFPELIP